MLHSAGIANKRRSLAAVVLWAQLVLLFATGLSEAKLRPQPPDAKTLSQLTERFTYEVHYGLLRLGHVHVYFLEDTVYRDTPVRHMVTEMISNPRLPIVGDRRYHYHNYLAYNDSIPYGLRFWQNALHRGEEERTLIDFDYEAGLVYSWESGELIDTLELDGPADAGPAIMYFSRLFAGTRLDTTYPIYIDHERSQIELQFCPIQEPYKSAAFPDDDIHAYLVEGNADFSGPFGFSGRFNAWFKDDELRIPLEARVQIFLGSVRVRLIEYERLAP